MRLNKMHIVCFWENKRNEKSILSFSLQLVKAGGYFLTDVMTPKQSRRFTPFSVNTEPDIPGIQHSSKIRPFNLKMS
jgi:hypothetical protein